MFSLENYKTVFENEQLLQSYFITISRTVIGTVVHTISTGALAYALSKKYLVFRNFYLTACVITMFFGGGMIASVINMRNLGFVNSYLVYIIPAMYSVYDMLIMKAFFVSLPQSLEDAAKIDGANDMLIFFRIVMPTSKPVVATIALMAAVAQWNAWLDAYIYVPDKTLWPMQFVLQRIILGASAAAEFSRYVPSDEVISRSVTPFSVQIATLMVAIGPILFIYPFFQKHFSKGFMIGSVKE